MSCESNMKNVARNAQVQLDEDNSIASFKSSRLDRTQSMYTRVLFLFAVLQVIALAFFTRGFLLSRNVLDNVSSCADQFNITGSNQCFQSSPFKKAVIIVIDALRFDFTIPTDNGKQSSQDIYYHNQFDVFYDTFVNSPENSLLLKFIADPPTTTLQRLKGLTTGSLPTFIDAGSNFDGDTVTEDNLISQFFRNNKRVAFAGDDTWDAMFSPYLHQNLTFPFDSLNVWDLHTVDDGVIDNIFPLLETERQNEWDILIGHFLGVDHCGHRYGPDHYSMKDKLQQMDKIIRKVMEQISDDTLLVVFGDHGMDSTGNHGGESEDEVEAALFMYSKLNVFGRKSFENYDINNVGKDYRRVNQIDIVPTLAMLLGVPIPFNNLGSPIEETFMRDSQNLMLASRLTSEQINTYRKQSSELKSDAIVNDLFTQLYETVDTTDLHYKYQKFSLDRCKELWATFDDVNIWIGICLLGLSLVVLITYSKLVPTVVISQLNKQCFLASIILIMVYCVLCVSFRLIFNPEMLPLFWTVLLGVALGISNGIMAPIMDRYSVSFLFLQLRENMIQNGWTYYGVFIIACHSLIYTSNSFIIWEDKIVSLWIGTFGVLAFFKSFQLKNKRDMVLGLYHSFVFTTLTKLVSVVTICREEQGEKCVPTFKLNWWTLVLLYFSALFLPTIITGFFNLSQSNQGMAPLWISKALRIMMFLVAILWTLEYIENDEYINKTFNIPLSIIHDTKLALARIIIGGSLVAGNFGWHFAPLCMDIVFENKVSLEEPQNKKSKRIITKAARIVGYGNAYGSSYVLLFLNWFVAILCVTKPLGQFSLFLFMNQLLSFLELINVLDIRMNLVSVVVLVLLGYQQFFSTGHQATLQAIHWESGFMLTQNIVFPFTHFAIILNTFGPFILASLAAPLLSLWRIPPTNKPIGLISRVIEHGTTFLIYQTFLTLSTLIMTNHFRRHLMVWKIFAPRYMLNSMVLVLVNVVIIFAMGYTTISSLKRWSNSIST